MARSCTESFFSGNIHRPRRRELRGYAGGGLEMEDDEQRLFGSRRWFLRWRQMKIERKKGKEMKSSAGRI
jgi:hypothetical protein